MPLWLRRNIAKYNAMHPNDEPDPKHINAEPPIRKPTIKSYNPVTKQAIVDFGNSDDILHFTDSDCFDSFINGSEVQQSSPPEINHNSNDTSSSLAPEVKQHASSTKVSLNDVLSKEA